MDKRKKKNDKGESQLEDQPQDRYHHAFESSNKSTSGNTIVESKLI